MIKIRMSTGNIQQIRNSANSSHSCRRLTRLPPRLYNMRRYRIDALYLVYRYVN